MIKIGDKFGRLTECEIEAIENLITRNKELEEKLEKAKIREDFLVGKKLAEINEHAKKVEIKMNALYVPKSKIKEILEQYKYTEIGNAEKLIEFYKKLQKLLEDS